MIPADVMPLLPDASVRLVGSRPDPPRDLVARIEQTWTDLLVGRPHLHDGAICVLERASPSEIVVASAPYRQFAAQRADPLLGAALGIVAVGVSGVVRVGARVLVGRRSTVSEYSGDWELVPSGALPATDHVPDPRRQLQVELEEETGIASRHIARVRILALIPDVESQTVDICGRIDVEMGSDDLVRAIARAPRSEYDDLRTLGHDELDAFRTTPSVVMVPTSHRLLDEFASEVWADYG